MHGYLVRQMPKTDPKNSYSCSATFMSAYLEETVLEELESILNLDPLELDADLRSNLYHVITKVLGEYPVAVDILDNAPRPANLRIAAENLRVATGQTLNTLCNTNEVVHESLSLKGVDIENTKKFLAELLNAARGVERDNEGVESRRAPKRHALRELVKKLASIFDTYRRRLDSEDSVEIDADRLDFIKTAMEGAGIRVPKDIAPYLSID